MVKYNFTNKGPKIIWIPFWLLVSARPRQWLKNLALFGPIVFEGVFFDQDKFLATFFGLIIFCMIASGIYILNDVIDRDKDRSHPFKSFRPIASGKVNPTFAIVFAFFLLAFALTLASSLSQYFMFAAVAYIILQVVYSMFLRSQILIDVMAIAAGFLLRVYAGAVLIDAHITVWFVLTVTSLALFLAIGKRRSERTLLMASKEKTMQTREILHHYPENLLDSLTVMFATACWLSYTMFTFLQPPPYAGPQVLVLFGDYLPRTFLASKWLVASVPFVIFGVMRYLYVIYEKKEGESPERVLLSDFPLLASVVMWAFIVFFIIYGTAILPDNLIRLLD